MRNHTDPHPENALPEAASCEASALSRPLRAITSLAVRFPKATIVLALVITMAALALTATRLGFRNRRADLLNPHSAYHQRWLTYIKEFGDQEDVAVVVEAEKPERVLAVMQEVGEALEREPKLFCAVAHECDLTRLRGKGLHYLTPEQLTGIDASLQQVTSFLRGGGDLLNLGQMAQRIALGAGMAGLNHSPASADTLAALDQVTQMLSAALESPEAFRSPWPNSLGSASSLNMLSRSPFITPDGKLGLVLLKLATSDTTSFDPHTAGLNRLREVVAQLQAKHSEAKLGLTGLPVIENDEMLASQTSIGQASILSFVGVALVFLAGFGGWRHPLIGNIALMAGMVWAYGFATLSIGHLNVLSSAFGAILIGQGIDFGVYYLAGYLEQRKFTRTSQDALVRTAGTVGPGIATGAVSTAIAFFAAGFTEFTGVAELGMIAGGGILLCFLAATILLPAMIQLADARRPAADLPRQLAMGQWLSRLHAHPAVVLVLLATVTGAAGIGLASLWYDHNLMNLQPAGMESVRLGKMVAERTGQSAYYALSMAASREEAIARKEAFLRQPSVAKVEEISSLMPSPDPHRQPLIERIHARLVSVPGSVPQIAVADVQELDQALAQLQALAPTEGRPQELLQRVQGIRRTIHTLDAAEVHQRIDQYQRRCASELLQQLTLLKGVCDPNPPQWSEVSPNVVHRFVSPSGKHLLKVYSRADIWDLPATERFIEEVRSVDREATGNPMQIYEASRQMKTSYEQAALYALVIVFFVVYLDFGSLWYTILALVPLGLGMLQMFGLMGLLNIPLNAANMIVLPLILGIGVDNGVHVLHDWRRQAGGHYRLSDSTANAVLINSLGNMVGFGSLMIASHQGLCSLGRVLTIGMACCLLSALAMPCLLRLLEHTPAKRALALVEEKRNRNLLGAEEPVTRLASPHRVTRSLPPSPCPPARSRPGPERDSLVP